MNINQFFLFAIERNMISNKNGIEIFYTAFKEACGGQDVVFLDHTKFHYAIQLLASTLFHKEESPNEAMFSQMLTD
jgi:6-phosphogluconolactonase (cycloisomerase 2 family)